MSASSSVLTAIAVVTLFSAQANQTVLGIWLIALVLNALVELAVWSRRRELPPNAPVGSRTIWILAGRVGISAALYAAMTVYLIDLVSAATRVPLVAIAAAVIAIGAWLFSFLPSVALTWLSVVTGSIGTGLLVVDARAYGLLVALLVFFALVLVAMILMTSRMFVLTIVAESEVERQHYFLGILLRDFEESASDWLWEIDGVGRLRRVSPRLVEILGTPPERLVGRSLVAVLSGSHEASSPADLALLDALDERLTGRSPFQNVVIPARFGGEPRWYSLTAKPLLSPSGAHEGWRGVASDVTEVRERELELSRLANVDSLTGLHNRHRFNTYMHELFDAAGDPQGCTLVLIDLDHFKAVNDSLGHGAGDQLLCELTRRLTTVVAADHLLARLGGDEFAIVMTGVTSVDVVKRLGRRIRSSLAAPFVIDGEAVDIRTSMGACSFPAQASSADELLKMADLALYAAKASGRGTLRFFDPSMAAEANQRLLMRSDLRAGLARGEFSLDYQPQIDLVSGRLIGFEALVRWHHPERGLIGPDEFIPIAEESGFIEDLGQWVLAKACQDASGWPSHLFVAINVSARQFAGVDLARTVTEELIRSGLPARRLELEITETALIGNSDAALEVLNALRRIGVRIALDDFGTGYSSLSYLRLFALDKLKIDKSFVGALTSGENHADSVAIVSTIIQLANTLRFETIAEGIETGRQFDLLRELGCSHGQGFLFARPLHPTQMAEFLAADKALNARARIV